ncbi:hypothetical protein PULV_a2010 [Pseudoalteromonas ulvae UL12]|nr:hypothetical protein [Pseudoalteromonas ulvae UL12]
MVMNIIPLINADLLVSYSISASEKCISEQTLISAHDSFFEITNSFSDGLILCKNNHEIYHANNQVGIFFPGHDGIRTYPQNLEDFLSKILLNNCTSHNYESLLEKLNSGGINELPVEFLIVTDLGYHLAFRQRLTQNGERVILIIDETREQLLIEQLDDAFQQAMKLSEAKTQFMAAMGHEIRTPLNAIIGLLDLIVQEKAFCQNLNIKTVHRSAHQLLMLLNNVLDFTKFNAGKAQLELAPANLRAVCENIIAGLAIKARESDIHLVLLIDPRIPSILIFDELRLSQVLNNLLNNALKFNTRKPGRVQLSITLNEPVSEQDACLHVEVSDNGIGISPQEQAKIFEQFTQASNHTHQQFGGTGLGLNISQSICHLMGSKLEVRSELAQGSVFYFNARFAFTDAHTESYPQLVTHKRLTLISNNQAFVDALNVYQPYLNFDVLFLNPPFPESDHHADMIFLDLDALTTQARHQFLQDHEQEKNIVLLDNGLAEPRLKQYLTFSFTPVRLATLNEMLLRYDDLIIQHSKQEEIKHKGLDLSSLEVLIVEDNPDNIFVMRQQLQSLNVYATYCEEPNQAIKLFKNQFFDVVITDYQMPNLNGAELTEQLRKIERQQLREPAPIALLTADKTELSHSACERAGIDYIFIKPFMMEELKGFLEEIQASLANACFISDEGESDVLFSELVHEELGQNAEPEPSHAVFEKTSKNFDLNAIFQFVGDVETTELQVFIRQYVINLAERGTQLAHSLHNHNFKEIHKIAHTIKSSALYIGATRLNLMAQELECLAGKMDSGNILEEDIDDLCQQMIDEIDDLVGHLKTQGY